MYCLLHKRLNMRKEDIWILNGFLMGLEQNYPSSLCVGSIVGGALGYKIGAKGASKQKQKAGDNSQQFQVQTMIVNNGIEEKRAREIFQEMLDVARKDLTQEAREIAIERVGKFEDDLIPKIEKIEGAINAFADPDFQFALTSAHKTAAATERENDYELLSELLIHRVHKKGNKNSCAGISTYTYFM